jgi:hypothetical protein
MSTVTMDGRYETAGGYPVRILCIDQKTLSKDCVIGLVETEEGLEQLISWNIYGENQFAASWNLVNVNNKFLHNLRVDDPIQVKGKDGRWYVSHFANITVDGVEVWPAGRTSKTMPKAALASTRRGAVEYKEFRPYRG